METQTVNDGKVLILPGLSLLSSLSHTSITPATASTGYLSSNMNSRCTGSVTIGVLYPKVRVGSSKTAYTRVRVAETTTSWLHVPLI